MGWFCFCILKQGYGQFIEAKDMSRVFILTLLIIIGIVANLTAQKNADSIYVYYMPLNFRGVEPISDPKLIKDFPLLKTFSITEPDKIKQIQTQVSVLIPSDVDWSKGFDIRIVCEMFYKGKLKQSFFINKQEYISYRRRFYKQSETLLKMLFPNGPEK